MNCIKLEIGPAAYTILKTIQLLKVPSHQFRSAWKWYRWVGLDEYMDRG
jgi:hypothetical protein